MTREAQIPLFLWIATAVVAHLLWGGGADKAADVISEKVEIREFAASVRRFVRGEGRAVEVTLLTEDEPELKPDPAAPEEEKVEPRPPEQKESAERDEARTNPGKDAPDEKKDAPKPDPVKEEPKPEEKKKEIEEEVVARELPVQPDQRVAVRQNVDPNQEDNPDAEFIGNEANRVKEQTQAKITSHDQNDAKPTPAGAAHSSNDPNDPGDSDESRIADSEDRRGAKDRAPQPSSTAAPSELRIAVVPAPARAPSAAGTELRREGEKNGSKSSESTDRRAAQEGAVEKAATHEAEAIPDTLNSENGTFSIARQRAASIEQQGQLGRKKRELPPLRSSGSTDLLGLGAAGLTPGGINLNLSPHTATAAIGKDQLVRERRADGERRKSQHAGRFRPLGIERWRASIENYVASVKPGNQTALNTARVPFANYLVQIHNRIHPIFAEGFLDSLDGLPSTHPLNRPEMTTNVEIVLDREEGRIARIGITKTSGVTAFDIAALSAVDAAAPFGPPPREIVSPDGNVYFHWEFHRNRDEACSTYFARPFILKGQPKSVPPSLPPAPAPPESESPSRHGRNDVPAAGRLALSSARP
jgi:TonB family protein